MKKQLFFIVIIFMVMILVPFVSAGEFIGEITDLKWDLGSDWQHVHEDINFPCEGYRCCGEDWACDYTKGMCCDQEVEKTIEKEISEFSFFDYKWESSHPTKETCGSGHGGSGKCFLEPSGLVNEKCDLVNLIGDSASHVDEQVYFCKEPFTLKFSCYQCGISYSVYPTNIKMDIYHKPFGSCDGFCKEMILNSYGEIGNGCGCYCKDGYDKQKKGEGLWECVKTGEEEDDKRDDEREEKMRGEIKDLQQELLKRPEKQGKGIWHIPESMLEEYKKGKEKKTFWQKIKGLFRDEKEELPKEIIITIGEDKYVEMTEEEFKKFKKKYGVEDEKDEEEPILDKITRKISDFFDFIHGREPFPEEIKLVIEFEEKEERKLEPEKVSEEQLAQKKAEMDKAYHEFTEVYQRWLENQEDEELTKEYEEAHEKYREKYEEYEQLK